MSRKLFVGGLSWNTTDEGLRGAFAKFGAVIEAKVVTDRETGRSRGFGFVTFQNPADGESARQAMDGAPVDGRSIRVSVAEEKPRGPRPQGDRGGPADRAPGPRGGFEARGGFEGGGGESRPPRSFEPRQGGGGFDRGPSGPPRGPSGPPRVAPPPPPPPGGFEGRGGGPGRRDRDRDRDREREAFEGEGRSKRGGGGRGRRRHEEADDLDD